MSFPEIPEALTEGETEEEAHTNAIDCVITALEGCMKAGRPVPRPSAPDPELNRAVLPSLVTAKLAVYETMRSRGWSKVKKELGMPENWCADYWTCATARISGSSTRHWRR